MNIQKLFGNNKLLATSYLAYLACFMMLFSGCEQHHKAVLEEKKLSEPEQLTWIGVLLPGALNQEPPEQH